MAQTIAYLEAVVGADLTSFRRGMAEIRSEIAGTAGLSSGLTDLGTKLTLGLTVPILGVAAAGLKMFSDFDTGMRNVNSIMQLPEDQFQKLGKEIQDFGLETRDGASAAATALYTIVSAGFGIHDTAEAMKVLSVATFGAEAGLADVNTVAQVLSQSLLAYGENAAFAQHNMDVLTQTVNLGVGSMEDVSNAFGQVISTAALMHISLDTLGGSMAFLTQRGMDFSEAAVSINQIMTQLLKPPKALEAAFASLGVATGSELLDKFGGLGGALHALWESTGESADGLAKLFTNVRALRGAASILENFGDYTDLMNEFGDSLDGVTSRAHQQQAQSLSYQFDRMKTVLQDFFITIGRDVAPLFSKIIDGVIKLGYWFHDLDPIVVQNAVKFGLLVAAIGPALIILGAMVSPVGLLITGLALLGKAFEDNFGGIRDFITSAWNDYIKPAVDGIVKAFSGDIPGAVKDFASSKIDVNTSAGLIKFFADLGDRVRFFVDSFTTNLQATAFAAQYWLGLIKSTFDTYFGQIFTSIADDITKGDGTKLFRDMGYAAQDAGHLVQTFIITPLTNFFNTTILPGIKQGLGDLFKGINPDDLTALAAALGAVLIPLGVLALIAAVSALPTFILGLAAAFSAWLIPLALILIPLGLIYVLIRMWQTNTLGFRDRINELGDTFRHWGEAIQTVLDGLNKLGLIDLSNFGLPNLLGGPGGTVIGGEYHGPDLVGMEPPYTGPDLGPPTGWMLPPVAETPGTTTPFPNSGGGGWGIGQNGTFGANTQNVQINIHSNDPDYILRELRRKGIDLNAPRRG